jgi:hypothetical protein
VRRWSAGRDVSVHQVDDAAGFGSDASALTKMGTAWQFGEQAAMDDPDCSAAPRQWGIEINGHDFDLQDWQNQFRPPFDPWVEKHDDRTPR